MTKTGQIHSYFDDPLHVEFILLIDFAENRLPVVWVDAGDRADLAQFSRRLDAIGSQAALLSQSALHRAYGHSFPHWLYARARHPDAFFVHLLIASPTVTFQQAHLPAVQVECSIRLDLSGAQTVQFIRAMVKSRSCLVRFDGAPDWVKQLPPLHIDEQGSNMSDQVGQLLLTSFPVNFDAAGIELIGRQLDAWERGRSD